MRSKREKDGKPVKKVDGKRKTASVNKTKLVTPLNDSVILERVFSSSNFCMAYMAPDFSIIRVNRSMAAHNDAQPDFFVGKNLFDLFPDSPINAECREAVAKNKKYSMSAVPIFDKRRPESGTTYWDFTFDPIANPAGGVQGIIMIALEVTDKERARIALADSHTRLLTILDGLDAIVYVADMKTYEVLYLNKAARTDLGDVAGKLCWKTFQKGQQGPCSFCTNENLLGRDGEPLAEPYVWEFKNTLLDRWYLIHDRAIRWVDGRLARLEMAFDITARKKAEDERRRLLAFNKSALENSPVGMSILDSELRVVYENPEMERIIGLPPGEKSHAIGKKVAELPDVAGTPAADALKVLYEGKKMTLETRMKFKYGVERDVFFHVSPIFDNGVFMGAIAVIQDLTERKAFEANMARKRRMEAVGTMARGVANDFNNALHSIVGLIQIAQSDIPEKSPAHEALSKAMRVGIRSGDLAAQILTFSGENVPNEREELLSKILEDSMQIVKRLVLPNISLKAETSRYAGPIFTDPQAISQVVVSLCANAIDAMKDTGGVLEVCSVDITVDDQMFRDQPDIVAGALRPGEYAVIAVKDTGVGMDEPVKERVFEPFFTTKPHNNEGRGLGLAAVHGIVIRQNGAIGLRSRPGEGAEFKVYLPKNRIYI